MHVDELSHLRCTHRVEPAQGLVSVVGHRRLLGVEPCLDHGWLAGIQRSLSESRNRRQLTNVLRQPNRRFRSPVALIHALLILSHPALAVPTVSSIVCGSQPRIPEPRSCSLRFRRLEADHSSSGQCPPIVDARRTTRREDVKWGRLDSPCREIEVSHRSTVRCTDAQAPRRCSS